MESAPLTVTKVGPFGEPEAFIGAPAHTISVVPGEYAVGLSEHPTEEKTVVVAAGQTVEVTLYIQIE